MRWNLFQRTKLVNKNPRREAIIMKFRLITLLFSFLLVLSVVVAQADPPNPDDWNAYPFVGTRILDMQKITIGARQAGMGEAFTGLADDINCGTYNPAGYALLNYKTISASHNEWLAQSNYNFFNFAMPYGKGTWTAGITYFDQGTVKEADEQGQLTGKRLGASDFQFSLGYATRAKPWFFPKMYLGFNARFIQNRLADEHRGLFLVDTGVLVPLTGPKFTLGLSVLNMGSGVQELPGDDALPPTTAKVGLGLNRIIDTESIDLSLAADFNFRKPFLITEQDDENAFAPRFNFGGEIWLKDLLALRAGYKLGYDVEDMTFGAGFKLNDYQLDYAYVDYGDVFGATHRLTATMTFGKIARADRDEDGIPDDADACPDEPEDFDGWQDTDGCPDFDNDNDGIFDEDDKCPNMPEYYNGFDDEDGCPDVKPAEVTQAPQPTETEELEKSGAYEAGAELFEGGPCIGEDCDDERGFYYLLAGYDYVRPILFDTDEYTIIPESMPALEKTAQIIEQCICEGDMIEIRGHADERASAEYNKELSERRANAVREYMISNFGLPADKLIAVGAGEAEPLMPNDPQYYQFNRRVVFRVIEQGGE